MYLVKQIRYKLQVISLVGTNSVKVYNMTYESLFQDK